MTGHCFAGVLVLAVLPHALPAQQRPPERGQLDASPALFTVMAAINAAGFSTDLESPANHPLRQAVRAEIAKAKLKVVDEIADFMREHRQEDAQAELRQYVSFALAIEDPPSFAFRFRKNELPPDLVAMEGLIPLLVRLHKDAGIDSLWKRSQAAIEQALAQYQPPAIQAITESSAYLRAPLSGTMQGRFQIYVDLLAPPNRIFFRPLVNEYYLVLTPSADSRFGDIRQAYLHFLLDPLATRFAEKVEEKRGLGDYAQGAPFLAEHFKQDFLLLATRSLIRAVEARLAPASRRAAMVDQAMKEGFVLTAHLAEQLPAYEKQERAMRMYFPDLFTSVDLKKEEKRLEALEFSQERVVRKAKAVAPPPEPEKTGWERALDDAEDLYTRRELDAARDAFAKVIQTAAEKPAHAKAYYGLARVATLRKDPELAERLFEKVLELEPPPVEKAWSLVYLGRLSEAAGDRKAAAERYQSALSVDGASAKAREAAEKGLQAAK